MARISQESGFKLRSKSTISYHHVEQNVNASANMEYFLENNFSA